MNEKKKPKHNKPREMSPAEKSFLAGLSRFNLSVVKIGGHVFENTEQVFGKDRAA